MQQAIIDSLQKYNLSRELIVFIISLLPILELRGGLIAASILKIPMTNAFFICYISNILPIPFILFFIKEIFQFLKKFKLFSGLILWLEKKAISKSESVKQKQLLGLFLFVAVPLPGTGAWTGALIASLLEMPIKKSFPTIALGVLFAGAIMVFLTYLAVPGLFGF